MRQKKHLGLPKIGLRWALLFYVVLPLAGSLALTGLVSFNIWEQQVEERMQSDLEVVARAIQLPLSYAMERDRAGGIQQALESALSIDTVYSAYAYDLEGRPIASAGGQEPDTGRDELAEVLTAGERTGGYGQVGSRRVYSYFVPLTDSRDQSSGLLQLTRRERDFREYVRRIRRHAWVGFGLSLLVMTTLVLLGHYHALDRHFRRLVSGMERVASGEGTHRVERTGPREIAVLAGAFNGMLDSIQASEKTLREKNREKAELEEQLRHTEKLAAVGQLAAGVAHELGTPLGTIDGTAQQQLRGVEEESRTAMAFRRIRREAGRMEVIIRQLLDFSHRHRVQCRPIHPERVAADVCLVMDQEAKGKGVALQYEGPQNAPVFHADLLRVEQALINLVRNAVQAAVGASVRLGWRWDETNVEFTVDDAGPGIPESDGSRIFEPFFTTKKVGEGTGLGLAVVYGIMQEHGGSVDCGKSDLGGARFRLRFPIGNAGQKERYGQG